MGFLTDITTRIRRAHAERPPDMDALREAASAAPPARDMAAALRIASERDGMALIGEVKRASPSAGAIDAEVDPVAQADAYVVSGAAAVSVLTEPDHFHGSLDDLRAVRASVGVPVLCKDFVVHAAQLLAARAAGADSVLLITACLSDDELHRLLADARDLGMEPLVETHADADVARALATDAAIVGVNARDLESLEVDVEAARRRLTAVGHGRVVVAESGIRDRDDVLAARAAGASAILVGETLMRAEDPAAMAASLLGRPGGGT